MKDVGDEWKAMGHTKLIFSSSEIGPKNTSELMGLTF